MENDQTPAACQAIGLSGMFTGYAPVPPESLLRRLRLALRRSLTARQVRTLKTQSGRLVDRLRGLRRTHPDAAVSEAEAAPPGLTAGDRVRVLSREEIQATLNPWGQLQGCMFMPHEMSPYCGTTQRVLKRLERFVDERDYRVKKCHGVVLLEGVMCQGTTDYGRCDRACFFFWREEWLETLNGVNVT